MIENLGEFIEIYKCSITAQIFLEPTTTPCGHSFEKSALNEWLMNHSTCPHCRVNIPKDGYSISVTTQNAVSHLLKLHPEFRKELFYSEAYIYNLIHKNETQALRAFFEAQSDKINEIIFEGKTALHLAVEKGNINMVQELLAIDGIDVNTATQPPNDVQGETPLHAAAELDRSDILKLLLEKSADPHAISNNGITPLQRAMLKGRKENVKLLLQYVTDFNAVDSSGQTILHQIVGTQDVDILKYLLSLAYPDPNLKDNQGKSALYIAAELGDVEKVKLLLSLPFIDAVASREPGDGKAAFEIALEKSHVDVCAVFTEPKVSLIRAKNYLQKQSWQQAANLLSEAYLSSVTPKCVPNLPILILAALHNFLNADQQGRETIYKNLALGITNSTEKMKYMLTYLACLYIDNKDSSSLEKEIQSRIEEWDNKKEKELFDELLKRKGNFISPFLKAFGIESLNKEICELVFPKVVKKAIENNDIPLILAFLEVDQSLINKVLEDGKTILHLAVEMENEILLSYLVESKELQINIARADGKTALHLAAASKTNVIVNVLLNHGANPDQATPRRLLPLHEAVRANNKDSIHLLATPQNINSICAENGMTALHCAIESNNLEITDILLQVPEINSNTRNIVGVTPLDFAALLGRETIFTKLLVTPGVKLSQHQGKALIYTAQQRGHVEIVNLMRGFCFALDLLKDGTFSEEDADMNFLSSLDKNALNAIFKAVENTGTYAQRSIDLARYYVDQIIQYKVLNTIKIDDNVLNNNDEKYTIWNNLLRISHASHDKHKYNWQGQIRQQAFSEFKRSLNGLSHEDKISKLCWAKNQAVFSSHRSSSFFFTLGKTKTVKEINKMIKQEEKLLKVK